MVTPEGLRLQGHAGAGPRGQDLVCAAVSILVETLAASVPANHCCMGQGSAKIACDPCSPEVRFVLRGLRLLARSYPQCLQITEATAADPLPP